MPSATAAQGEPRTYGNWRKPTTPGLPGLGLLGTAIALGGLVLTVLVQMIAGVIPATVTLLLVLVVVAPLLYRNRSGRNGWQALTAASRSRGIWPTARISSTALQESAGRSQSRMNGSTRACRSGASAR